MNKIFTLVTVCICVFYTGSILATPLVKLIVSPCEFDKKEVDTSGFLGFPNPLEPNRARLFLTIDDFKFNNFDQSIIVNVPDNLSYKRELWANKFVNIQGSFDCSISSHGNFGSGGFKSISEIALPYENPNFNSKNFPNGLIKEVQSKKIAKFGDSIINEFTKNREKKSMYKFLFSNANITNIRTKRLNWIFNTYLSDISSEKFKLCKIYEYENQEFQETDGITDGLICFAKGRCNSFPKYRYAEDLPDWSDSSNELCFSFE
ncbi:hypothetical protein, partial [Marinicella sediminis]